MPGLEIQLLVHWLVVLPLLIMIAPISVGEAGGFFGRWGGSTTVRNLDLSIGKGRCVVDKWQEHRGVVGRAIGRLA